MRNLAEKIIIETESSLDSKDKRLASLSRSRRIILSFSQLSEAELVMRTQFIKEIIARAISRMEKNRLEQNFVDNPKISCD
ncbi:MAG: hypothetical protein AB1393_14095 [Candidatus Edwardsbacteria bacterium]